MHPVLLPNNYIVIHGLSLIHYHLVIILPKCCFQIYLRYFMEGFTFIPILFWDARLPPIRVYIYLALASTWTRRHFITDRYTHSLTLQPQAKQLLSLSQTHGVTSASLQQPVCLCVFKFSIPIKHWQTVQNHFVHHSCREPSKQLANETRTSSSNRGLIGACKAQSFSCTSKEGKKLTSPRRRCIAVTEHTPQNNTNSTKHPLTNEGFNFPSTELGSVVAPKF